MSTCLQLPLLKLPVHQLPASQSTIRQVKDSDIFYFDTNKLMLVFHTNFQQLPHCNSSKQVNTLIQSNQLLLNHFFLFNFCQHLPRPTNALDVHFDPTTNTPTLSAHDPFLSLLIANPDPVKFSMSINYFKNLRSFHLSSLITSSSLPSSKWNTFWKLSIPLNARNTWFRLLHHKIIQKESSSAYASSINNLLSYLLFSFTIETVEHFLFDCPSKHIIWSTVLLTNIDPMFNSPTFN
ncbi:hypothetical protein [Parasitella parasitica]|uniref:Reverse transcriptase zinc-binding domain-containing protein n=1 Tax=Parasitella parasitica TaxID=35722 RepID=A0A0B7MR66_9FUNG|nr:hypothetical protein [Parasitella parasitica]